MNLLISKTSGRPQARQGAKPDTAPARVNDSYSTSVISRLSYDDAALIRAEEDSPKATDALIVFIQKRYYSSQLTDLDELLRLAYTVEVRCSNRFRAFQGAIDILHRLHAALTAQIDEDRSFLFPMMLSGARPKMMLLLNRETAKHYLQLAFLEQLENLVKRSEAPTDGHTAWRTLEFGLTEFAEDLRACVHIKHALLFPRFR